jgi:hypothetical protein
LSTDPIFYKVRREKSHKGKDSLYSFRSGAAGKEGVESRKIGGGDGDSTAVIDVEGDVIDVDGVDDPPPLPVKRSATHSTARPAKKSKVPKMIARKSRVEGATAVSNVSQMSTQSSPPVTAEERRLNRRRAELESKIQAALEARLTSMPESESNRIVCIPIRIDVHPSTSTIGIPTAPASTQQPLALKNGEIVLSSNLFSHVSTEQLQLLRRLETPRVLEILTAEFKKSLVEEYRMKKAKTKPTAARPGVSVSVSVTANVNSGEAENVRWD